VGRARLPHPLSLAFLTGPCFDASVGAESMVGGGLGDPDELAERPPLRRRQRGHADPAVAAAVDRGWVRGPEAIDAAVADLPRLGDRGTADLGEAEVRLDHADVEMPRPVLAMPSEKGAHRPDETGEPPTSCACQPAGSTGGPSAGPNFETSPDSAWTTASVAAK
jgi:hypothetical protein